MFSAGAIPAGEDYGRAAAGKLDGGPVAYAGVGSGDEETAVCLGGDLGGRPREGHLFHSSGVNFTRSAGDAECRRRDGFEFASGSDPGLYAAFDDAGPAVFLLEHVGHALAGGVADAGAVEVDLALRGHELAQGFELFFQARGLDADGVFDALHTGVIVVVAADVGDDDELVGGKGLQALAQLFGGDLLDLVVLARLDGEDDQRGGIDQDREQDDEGYGMSHVLDEGDDGVQEMAEDVSDEDPCGDVEGDSGHVEPEESPEAHVEAAGERGGHGGEAGDEFGEEQGLGSAAVEVGGGGEDATSGLMEKRQRPARSHQPVYRPPM